MSESIKIALQKSKNCKTKHQIVVLKYSAHCILLSMLHSLKNILTYIRTLHYATRSQPISLVHKGN